VRKEERVIQDAKKGWQSASNEFGGSFSQGKSPGSAGKTLR
jgi:hypothetical protein